MSRVHVSVLVLVALASGALSGCGDDDGLLSRAELVERGNDVCRELTTRLREVVGAVDVTDPEAVAAAVASGGVDALRDAAEGLAALAGPAAIEAELRAFVAELGAVTDRIERDPSIVTGADTDPFTEFDRRARGLGLDECAGP